MKEGIDMLTLVFMIRMLAVFGKVAVLALRGAWGLTKSLFSLIFLPFILIGLVLNGLIFIALPVLIVVGVVLLLTGVQA